MLPFTLRRVFHPGIFSTAQILPKHVISSNQSLTITIQRNFATTVNNRNSDSSADSESSKPESKPKSTRRKTGSSTKAAGKEGKAEKKSTVAIRPEDKPPKIPGNAYILWLSDWLRSQSKFGSLDEARNSIKRGAEVWHTVSDQERQRYREKSDALRAEYYRRIEQWRESVDPSIIHELNRRRLAKGMTRLRGINRGEGVKRPVTGYHRYYEHVRNEHPRTEEDYKTYFSAVSKRASSQWKAMSDAEKAEYTDPAKADFDAWREKRGAGKA